MIELPVRRSSVMDLIASARLAQVTMGNPTICEIPDATGTLCGHVGDHLFLMHKHVAHRDGRHSFAFEFLDPPVEPPPGSPFMPAQPCYKLENCERCLTAVITWNGTCVVACLKCAQLRADGTPNNPRIRFVSIQNVQWLRDHPALLPLNPFPHKP